MIRALMCMPLILMSHIYRVLGWELIWSLYTVRELEALDEFLAPTKGETHDDK